MGLRLRKIIPLGKGLRLNLSKRGGSFSIGRKGFTVNIGKDGVRSTTGLPGSGISYSEYASYKDLRAGRLKWVWIALTLAVMALIAVWLLSA